MDDRMIIRPAVPSDVAETCRMSAEFDQYLHRLDDGSGEPVPGPVTGEVLLRHGFGANPWFRSLVVELNGRTVGDLLNHFGYWAEDAAPSLHVADLFVPEEVRATEVGSALMSEAAAILRGQGRQAGSLDRVVEEQGRDGLLRDARRPVLRRGAADVLDGAGLARLDERVISRRGALARAAATSRSIAVHNGWP